MQRMHAILWAGALCLSVPQSRADMVGAQQAMDQGHFAEAHQLFQQELTLRPNGENAQGARWLSARCLLELRDYAAFGAEADAFHAAHPGVEQDYWLRYWKAMTPKYAGDAAASLAALNALAAESGIPVDLAESVPWSALECLLDLRDFAGFNTAFEAFRAAHPQSESNHQGRLWQAAIPGWQGNRAASIAAYKALAADPSLPALYAQQARMQLIQLYLEAGDQAGYLAAAQSFIAASPNTPEAWSLRQQIAALPMQSGDYATAQTQLQALLSSEGYPAEIGILAKADLAQCYLHLSRHAELEQLVDELTQSQPSHVVIPRLLFWHALSLKAQGEHSRSLGQLDRLINTFPGDALQADAQWERAQGLLAALDYDRFATFGAVYLADFPEGERAQWMRLWLASVPALQNNPAGSIDGLTAVVDDPALAPAIRAEVEWKLIEALYAAREGAALGPRMEAYLTAHPETDKRSELQYWQAHIPVWSGDLHAAAQAFAAYAADAGHPAALRESAHAEQINCLYTLGEVEALDAAAQSFGAAYPESPQRIQVAYLRALAPVAAHRLSEAAYRASTFLLQHPGASQAQDVAYWRVRLLHDAERFAEVDAAADYYSARYGAGKEADYVAYVRMLVPLNGIEKDWDQAIARCEQFKLTYPQSRLIPNANLNLGWALCAKSKVLKLQGQHTEADHLRLQGHLTMVMCRSELPEDDLKGDIDRCESYYLEDDFVSLAKEGKRQAEAHSATPSRYASGMYYYGIALARLDPQDYNGAIDALQRVINSPLSRESHDAYILSSATWWLMGLQAGKDHVDLAKGTYEFAKTLPETSLKQAMLTQYSNLD